MDRNIVRLVLKDLKKRPMLITNSKRREERKMACIK